MTTTLAPKSTIQEQGNYYPRRLVLETPRKLHVSRLLVDRLNIVATSMPPNQNEKLFVLDMDGVKSETPLAVWDAAHFFKAQGLWQGMAPNVAIIRRNASRSPYHGEQLRQETGRLVGVATVTSIQGALELKTFEPVSLKSQQIWFAPDGSTATVNADDYRQVTGLNSGRTGYHMTVGILDPAPVEASAVPRHSS